MTTGKKILNLLLAPLILLVAVGLIVMLVKSRKTPPPRKPVVAVPRVVIVESEPADAVPKISTYGNVRAYHETEVSGLAGGRIEAIAPDFDPGRAVTAGDLLAKIEEADYKSALAERESALAAANPGVNPDVIVLGSTLVIPGGKTSPPPPAPAPAPPAGARRAPAGA